MFAHRQVQVARVSLLLVVSLALTLTVGCSRDPNVRKQKYLESGKHYETEGKYKEAAIQFSNALKVDNRFAPAYYELAKTYLKMNSAMPAYSALLKTVDLDPNNLEARITLGNFLLAGGAKDRAEAQAKEVLSRNPNYADGYALLAAVEQSKGDSADALKDIHQAISLDPNHAGYHSALALLDARDPANESAAEMELQKAASLDAKSPTPHILLAALLEKKNDLAGAEQQLTIAIGIAPQNLQVRESLAGLYLHEGNKDKAEQTLHQAVLDMPDNEAASSVLAEYYGKTGQTDKALSVFGDLNSKYPKSFGIKLTYARILYSKKDFPEATTILTQLTKSDSGNPEVQTLNALLLLNTGKVDDAFALLKKAVKDSPSPETELLLGRVALVKGDTATAETSLRQAAKMSPGNVEAASGLASIAIARNDAGMLFEIADQMIKMHPDLLNAYLWRGTAEASRKEYDQADSDFEAVIKADPNNSPAYLELAQIRIVQGRAADAKDLLQKALDKDPNSIRALSLLLSFDMQAKQPAKAIQRAQAQIAKVPGNGSFYAELAKLQMATRDYKGALESATKAMQLNPTSSDAIQIYGAAEVATGNTDSAVDIWQKWMGTHPSDGHALDILGSLAEAKGNQSLAMDYYKKALGIDSNDAVASNNLAYLMVDTNQNTDVALSLAQTARRILPDSPQTADTLAWIYVAKGDYGASRDLLESALRRTPDNASMHYHLGVTYLKLNDKPDALIHLKKAAALDPNGKIGKDATAELGKL